jgi:hypothetical protein
MRQLLVMANIPSSPILVTLMMDALSSPKTSVLTKATWHNIPEDGILQYLHLEYQFFNNLQKDLLYIRKNPFMAIYFSGFIKWRTIWLNTF